MVKIIISIATALALLLATVAHAGNTIVQKTYGNQSPVINGSNNVAINYNTSTKKVYDLSNVKAPDCSVQEIYEALKDLSSVNELSRGWSSTTLEYRTPSAEMEHRYATILKARDVLERCGKYFKEAK